MIFSAALAVPYFVNWNDQRDIVAAQISKLLGAQVKINGTVDLKVLPTPYLVLGKVEISDPVSHSSAQVAEIRLEIALASLLHGDVDFVEAQLEQPHIRATIADNAIHLPKLPNEGGDIRFERVAVHDGEIAITDPATGRDYVIAGLNLEAAVPSLSGPFKGEGRFDQGGSTDAFRFSTAAFENNQLRFKLVLDATRQHPRADLDGNLTFDAKGLALPALDARLTLTAQADAHPASSFSLPWRLTGNLHAALRQAKISDIDLRLGDDDHSVNLGGAAEFDLGAKPRGHIAMTAKQVNLDRLLTEKNAPPPTQRVETMLREWIAQAQSPAFPLAIDWAFETVSLGDETFGDISGAINSAAGGKTALRLHGEGPGDSRLSLDGKLETGSAPGFDGHIDAGASDLPRLRNWIAAHLPDLEMDKADIPFRGIDISGKMNISQVGFFGSNLRLRLDRTQLAGSLAYTRMVGTNPPRFYADLAAQALDLDHLPDMHAAFDSLKPMDLSLRLDSHAVRVANAGQGPIDAGRIIVKFTKAGGHMSLEKLDVTGLGGMNLSATGNFDGAQGHIEGKLDADRLADAAGLMQRMFPGAAADLLAKRAAGLSPTHLNLVADIQKTQAGSLVLSALSLKGSAAQTKIAAQLAPDAHDKSHVAISAHLDAADASALFRQFGFAALPLKSLGGGQIDVTAQGELAKPLTTQISATLAGAKLEYHGMILPDLTAPRATGTLSLSSRDLSGLLETTALAFPDLTGQLPADLNANVEWHSGDLMLHKLTGSFAGMPLTGELAYAGTAGKHINGSLEFASLSLASFVEMVLGPQQTVKAGRIWSEAAFGAGLIDPPTTSLTIKTKNLTFWPGIVGTDAKFNLDLSADQAGPKLGLRLISARLGAGSAEANLSLRRDGANAAAEGHLTVQGYDLALPSLDGHVSANMDFASTGANAAALVAGFAGSGTLTFSDLTLPHSDPRALTRIFNAIETDQIGIDEGEINRALAREFEKQSLVQHNVGFDMGLAAGILRLTPKADATPESPAPDQQIACTMQANIDLRNLSLEQRTRLDLGALPKDWNGPQPQVTLIANGPILRPGRTIETAAFTNTLAARAIARESARLEQQEFELHERAFFYQRLHAERRREQERLKAEDDARRAAEEAKRAMDLAAEAANRPAEEPKTGASPTPPVFELRRTRPLRPLDLHPPSSGTKDPSIGLPQ